MRKIILILTLALFLAACGGKNDAPNNPDAANATAANATALNEAESLGDSVLDIRFEPLGAVIMSDGREIPLVEFKKLGKYYLYITGKLDGRASTVISFTRLNDIAYWAGIAFRDPTNFVIVTRKEKQLHFTDAHIFLGSDEHDTFSFITSGDNYTTESVDVKKSEVTTIKFTFKPTD